MLQTAAANNSFPFCSAERIADASKRNTSPVADLSPWEEWFLCKEKQLRARFQARALEVNKIVSFLFDSRLLGTKMHIFPINFEKQIALFFIF